MTGLYKQLYDLLVNVLFGADVETFVWADFICQAISAIGCVLLISIPFIIIWRVIRTLM